MIHRSEAEVVLQGRGCVDAAMCALYIEARIAKGRGLVEVAKTIDLSILKNLVDADEGVRLIRGQHGGEVKNAELAARAEQMPSAAAELDEDERPSDANPSGRWNPKYDLNEEQRVVGKTEIPYAQQRR